VRRRCLLNYGPGLRCPVLRHRKIQAGNSHFLGPVAEVGNPEALTVLWKDRLLTAGVEDEEQIRDVAELPKAGAAGDAAGEVLAPEPPGHLSCRRHDTCVWHRGPHRPEE
jgi:hypothetical protein